MADIKVSNNPTYRAMDVHARISHVNLLMTRDPEAFDRAISDAIIEKVAEHVFAQLLPRLDKLTKDLVGPIIEEVEKGTQAEGV